MALSYPNSFTYTLNGGANGLVVTLPNKVRRVQLKIDDSNAAGECWIRLPISPESAPSAPSGTPDPAAETLSAAGWQHLKGIGSEYETQILEFGFYEYIELWDIGAGGLSIVCEE